jgi:DNA-binding transcriptional MocR family regulator
LSDTIGPDYRRVIDLIRSKITTGEWPVGRQIPSTPDLIDLTSASITPVRRAVQQLQADGILEGHPGKGVFVKSLPDDADREHASLETLGGQVSEVRDLVKGYPDLRDWLGRLEANLMDLYNRLGFEYPHGGEYDNGKKTAAGRGRARR